jgi:formate hydrogenlyase transcriptional activator
MSRKILIVEDQFVEANDLQLMLVRAKYEVTGIARSVVKAQEMIRIERPDFVILDIFLKGNLTGIDFAKDLKEMNIPFVYLSANSDEETLKKAKTTEPYGFLVKPFRDKDVLVTLEIATYRHEQMVSSQDFRESKLTIQLENIKNESLNLIEKLPKIGKTIQSHIPFDFLTMGLNNEGEMASVGIAFQRVGFEEYQTIGIKELLTISGLSLEKWGARHSKNASDDDLAYFNGINFERKCENSNLQKLFFNTFKMQSYLVLPLIMKNGKTFPIGFYSRKPDAFQSEHLNLLQHLEPILTKTINEISTIKNDNLDTSQTQNNISKNVSSNVPNSGFEGIIGKSHLLLNVFDNISQVAPTDTSVLILGESGTGKEGIANSIHQLSKRKGKPFIKVNCAGLPANLIESELFGHEKGSFTGATEKRIGKFEQADQGTIFLDEIGEIPIELQVKLLRVLQEKEIDRIGGKDSIKVNIRVIAATNRNLEKEVASGHFRLDLYYRLNVFPITLPALKERREDIPILVTHFMNQFCKKMGKNISSISDNVMKNLMEYNFPGNIRELEHLIERSVLLTKGSRIEEISLPSDSQNISLDKIKNVGVKTIDENEKEFIVSVLKRCKGKIFGRGGAAELLEIPPTTLASKMKKLGIHKGFYSDSTH